VRCRVDDAVAWLEPIPAAGDDEEHVLGRALRQLDCRTRRELEAAEAYGDGARRLREVGVRRELIPVGEQAVPQ